MLRVQQQLLDIPLAREQHGLEREGAVPVEAPVAQGSCALSDLSTALSGLAASIHASPPVASPSHRHISIELERSYPGRRHIAAAYEPAMRQTTVGSNRPSSNQGNPDPGRPRMRGARNPDLIGSRAAPVS